ncbi:alpha/beta hydrolase family protein [Actinomadura decatromicini]|uniref:Alpha/beta fold hydrolase n=1 Tax=Actinomadura decatromicini TaxID=2604572 RepID=A0A5D3FWV9_9ACTN|nr:alpha/beta fold hydrolase [Actinomadura decatromicini]TYK52489.1 alpha/beta fold hydrolase [Actinomadura decatromicini]
MTAAAPDLAVPDLPPVPTRFGFAFSAGGRWAACLSAVHDDVTLERWDLAGPAPARRALASTDGGAASDHTGDGPLVGRACAVLPLDDGRVLVVRPATGDHGEPAGHGTVLAAGPAGAGLRITRSWQVPSMLAGFLLAGPDRTALLVTVENERNSRISRLTAAGLEPVLRIPGVLSGGVWVDRGRTLALDHSEPGRRADGILVDLRERSWRRVWSVADTTSDRIAAYSPRSGALAVTTTSPGVQQAGAQQTGLRFPDGGPVRFPETLNRSSRLRTPLTFDPSGEHLLLREIHGASARLAVYTPDADRVTPVPGPRGMLWGPARWADDGRIHVRFAAPHRPPTLATAPGPVPGPAGPAWTFAPEAPGAGRGWRRAELVELPGPAGPIEAIVYGDLGSRRLVLALHGGPLAAWRFEFEPLFQHLAAAGAAVVAPNYRGSTGYGERHLRPVLGDWGGPDLDDVVHLGRTIARDRDDVGLPRPVVLGGSYGAFLALLAACRFPELWSGCAALAPFTSADGLRAAAPGAVGDRVARLSRIAARGEPGPGRDVLAECASLTAPLLLVHGARDEIVPVAQSRALRRRLLELGRTEGVDFDYLEADGDHHGVVQAWPPVLRETVVRFCLAAERTYAIDQERR